MRTVSSLLLLVPLLGFAAPPNGRAPAANAEQGEQRLRWMRLAGIAEALNLSDAQALKVGETLRAFDDKRRPWRQQLGELNKIINRAAEGDPNALQSVDEAVQKLFEARAQIAQIDRDQFAALAAMFNPQQRARLAVFPVRFDRQQRERGVRERMLKQFMKQQQNGAAGFEDAPPMPMNPRRRWRMQQLQQQGQPMQPGQQPAGNGGDDYVE